MNMNSEQDLEILRAINVSGAVTPAELQAAMPALGDPKKAMERLWSHNFLNCERIPSKPSIFTIAAKGRRLLLRQPAVMGSMPTGRTEPSSERYTGERNTVHREGAMDAYRLPSIHNGERKERQRPLLIGGKAVEAVGIHGGRAA